MIPASLADRLVPESTRRAREFGERFGWHIEGVRIDACKRRRRESALARVYLRQAFRHAWGAVRWSVRAWRCRLAIVIFFGMLLIGFIAGLLGLGPRLQRASQRALRRRGYDPTMLVP